MCIIKCVWYAAPFVQAWKKLPRGFAFPSWKYSEGGPFGRVTVVPNSRVCLCMYDCVVIHDLQSKMSCRSSWASDWICDSEPDEQTERAQIPRRDSEAVTKEWTETSQLVFPREVCLYLWLIPFCETLFIFLFLNWLCYFVVYSHFFSCYSSPWKRNISNVKTTPNIVFSLHEAWCFNEQSWFFPSLGIS